jgi:hypothetical protein
MNNWIENEMKRLLDGNNYQYGVPTRYAYNKAKLLEQLRWFQVFALKRQLEVLVAQDLQESSLKSQGGFEYSDLPYKRIFNKTFKIKIIKQILKNTVSKNGK